MELDIFQPKYASLLTSHGYSVEHLGSILMGIGYDYTSANTKKAKIEASKVIEQLLYYEIIEVNNWGKYEWLFKDISLDKTDIVKISYNMMLKVKEYHEYYEMIYFKYTSWYYDYHEKSGINIDTDWNWFNEKFVPNIKKWIKENR